MKKLAYSRNIIYIFLITFVCFMPVLTAYFMSHDSSYFASKANFSIEHNGSHFTTKQINDKLLNYTQQNHVSIAKRIFVEKNNHFQTKTIVFGNKKGIKDNSEKLTYTGDNSNLLADYAIFHDKHPQRLFNYLKNLGIQINIWNPISVRTILSDTVGVIVTFYFNYLIAFLVLIIILLNIFTLFQKRKYNSIKKLFKGYSNSFSYMNQAFNELKYLVSASVVIEIVLYVSTVMLAPDLTKLALVSSLFLNGFVTLVIAMSTLLLIWIFSKFSMVEILKGKGNYRTIAILSLMMVGGMFLAFSNIIKVNINSNIQINNLNKSDAQWDKLNNYHLLDFNNIDLSDKGQQVLSNQIVHHFPESQLLLSLDYPYYRNALMTNTNYFSYQKIKYRDGTRVTPQSFSHAITLLTCQKISKQFIQANYARPLDVQLKNIKVVYVPKQHYYKYLTQDEDQTASFSHPEQVVVLNLHEARKISRIVSQNLVAWASQRQLMFNFKNINDAKKTSANLKDIESVNTFRAQIQHTIYYNHTMLLLNLCLSILIFIVCGYFAIYILFSANRKKLFLMKINGKGFLARYATIYMALIVAISPGAIYLFMISNPIFYMTMVVILLMFTLQIWINEQSNYTILKGKL